jgi:hypothetical protein
MTIDPNGDIRQAIREYDYAQARLEEACAKLDRLIEAEMQRVEAVLSRYERDTSAKEASDGSR